MQKEHSLCEKAWQFFIIVFRSFVRVLQYYAKLIVFSWGRNLIKSDPRQSKKNESITFLAFIVAFDFRGGGDELRFRCILVFLDLGVYWWHQVFCSQRYDPEMQDFPHNGSSAGDRNPFVVSYDQGSDVLVPMPHTLCCTPDVNG